MESEAGRLDLHQLQFSEEKIGKMMKNNKLRISWGFVLSDTGHTEHSITLIWSKSTGKQQIEMDGTEIWFGRNQGRSILDHNWKTRDNRLSLHLLASCAPKLNENFRNYDLIINGQLFASLPHYVREGSNSHIAPIPPPMGKDNVNSIIQILYPNGYVPPVDEEEKQQREEAHQTQRNTLFPTPEREKEVVHRDDGNDNTNNIVLPSSAVHDVDLLDNDLSSSPVTQQPEVDLLG